MASLGEADLTVGTWIAGRIRVLNIHPDAALYPRLGIVLGVTLNDIGSRSPSEGSSAVEYEWRDVAGELRLSEVGNAVGLVTWAERKRPLQPTRYVHEHQVRLVCELDPWRLEVLERHRNGSAPSLWLQLWPTLLNGTEFLNADARVIRMDIPREQWLEFLARVRGSQFDVLEIQYTAQEAERFQRAISRTREARAQIAGGEYDAAVAECRKVLEALGHELKEEGQKEPLRNLFEQRTDPRRAHEYLGIVSRIKQLSGFVHHDFGVPLTYTRAEAQFVLRTTESVLSLVGALTTPGQPATQ